jgi:long-chain acyl-CoA synthetase
MPGVTIALRPDANVPPAYRRVHVRSDAVCSGYFGDGAGSSDLRDGGFLTGDYGTLLDDGRLVLAGRISSFINVAGRKVEPGEVERVLRTLPGVADVRVLAATDPSRGEQIAAVIAGGVGLTLAEVRTHCASRLASHKIPRVVTFVDRLPVTPRGKIDHRALDALIRVQTERTC